MAGTTDEYFHFYMEILFLNIFCEDLKPKIGAHKELFKKNYLKKRKTALFVGKNGHFGPFFPNDGLLSISVARRCAKRPLKSWGKMAPDPMMTASYLVASFVIPAQSVWDLRRSRN